MRLRVTNERGAPTLGITLLLASLSMLSPLSIDTFLPSLPAIAADFNITSWQAQQLLTAYLVPFAAFSLVHGPLSDALGRRKVVLGGLMLYTVGSIGCVFAPSFGLLLACRFLQGMAAGIGSTVARAVVRDLFEGANAQKLMASMMLVFSLAPALAPIIGGWMHVGFGWRSVFGLMLTLGVLLLMVSALLLPETHPREKRIPFHPGSLLRSCWKVASDPSFLLLAAGSALAMAPLFTYIGSTPAIIMERWQLKETQFHYVFIPVVAGFMTASLLGSTMAGRVPRQRQLALGFTLVSTAAITSVVAHQLSDGMLIPLTQVVLYCMAIGAQITSPVMSLEMLDMHPLARGAAASVSAFVMLGIGAVMMGMIAPLLHGDLTLLAWISLASCGLAASAWRIGQRLRNRHAAAA